MNWAQRLVLVSLLTFGFFAHGQNQTEPEPQTTTQHQDESAKEPSKEGLSSSSSQSQKEEIPKPAEVPTETRKTEAPASTKSSANTTKNNEEIPAAKRSLLKSAAVKGFSKPMYFDQLDNGVILPPLELEYDLSDGKSLKLGNVTFEEKSFSFALLPLGKAHPQFKGILSDSEAAKPMLIMFWPEALLSHGNIEVISHTGTVLWSHSFSDEDRQKWQKNLADLRQKLISKGVPSQKISRAGIFGSQFAFDAELMKAALQGKKDFFRFCISQTDGRNTAKMCSQKYGTKSSGHDFVMGKLRMSSTARVLVQSEEAPLKNDISVAADTPASFFAELSTGESYEFVTWPNKLQLMDIADTNKPNVLRIVGYGTRPIGHSVILNPDQYSTLTKLLGFEATIGDSRKFWAMAVLQNDPKVYLPGQGGGVFKQRFELSEIPRALSRVYLSDLTPTGTYIDGIELTGRKQPTAKISTSQNFAKEDSKNPASFTWNFGALERGKINRSYLNVEVDGKLYKSYFEIYKGYPRELSGRFSGLQASGSMVIMGEIAYNQWFEDLFGWTDYWMSRQRWGVSAKYFQSFNKLKVDAAASSVGLNVMTVDLKYRLTPGLWGRDESVGGMLSYQNVSLETLKDSMVGVGAFWARSMPKVFDDLFNLVPIMRYPKWVDMEYIYYVSSMDSKVTLNSSMSLNFHGKVLWSEHVFGEAGFGMKRYGFTDASLNQKAALNTFYGTVGLGVNF
ncbi:MAG: hypothetical protein ACXVCY_17520 [Pseudobdellovibrionaceae bacterium]